MSRKVIVGVALFGLAFYSFFAITFGLADKNNVSGLHEQAPVFILVWIVLLAYFLYRSRGWIASWFHRTPDYYSFAPQRTPSKYWRCPNCKATLEKSQAGMSYDNNVFIYGTVTCGSCGTQFLAKEVYGGSYDV